MATYFETKLNRSQVQEWIIDGKTRKEILTALEENGVSPSQAKHLYYDTLKGLAPAPDFLENHKAIIIQQNLDRLEKIIQDCIDGQTGEKKVALQAIAELNKMCGVYEANKVTIAKNQEGDEMIQITFDK